MAQAVLSNTIGTINNLAIQEVTFLRSVNDKVDLLKTEFRSMQNFLKEVNETQRVEDRHVRDTVCEIWELAYKAENIIEKINWMNMRRNQSRGFMGTILRYAHLPGDWITLHNLGVKIDAIIGRISQIPKRKDVYINVMPKQTEVGGKERDVEDENLLNLRAICPDMVDNLDIVGFDDKINEIVKVLLDSNNTHLTIVSIVGMGGIGKSTLARKVYTDPRVFRSEKKHFDTNVWVTVSKTYEIDDLLENIMRKCSEVIGGFDNEVENTRQKIHGFLQGQRYLIVLDDVWSTNLWQQINLHCKTFCDMNNGSRIILTTRNNEVANQARPIATLTHELEPLDGERSWELLRKKAFPSYQNVSGNTNELERLGKILAKKCDGLPLALVVLGGYLSKHLDPHKWSNISQNLLWEDADNQMSKVLALSYHDLQDQLLKSCFLYTASFPEDRAICVSDLVRLWIAEGFVEKKRMPSLEEAARRKVDELAQRCMVRVVERSKTGQIKKIRIHDVLRDWSIEQASKDGFLKVCTYHDDLVTSSSNAMLAYRVAFHRNFDNKLHESMPELRTIIISLDDYERQLLIQRFRYLRVLNISGAKNLKALSKSLEKMIYLRYLGLRNCGSVQLPSSMNHLLNLQTLDSRGTEIIMVPRSLWRIQSLRHVHFGEVEWFEPLDISQQNNLLTLSMDLSHNKNIITHTSKMLPKSLELMAQLTSLNFSCNEIPVEIMISFARSEHLRALKLVGKLIGHEQKLPNYNLFAPNLVKLTLIGTELLEDPIPTLEKLPNLVVLRLGLNSFLGRRMTCSQTGFSRLQYLILNLPNVAKWEIVVGAMPELTHLVFYDCSKLKVFPRGIHNLRSLVVLEFRGLLAPSWTMDDTKKLEKNGCKVINRYEQFHCDGDTNQCCIM